MNKDEKATMIGAGLIGAIILLIIVFVAGYYMADGSPDVINLEESQANSIRLEEQQKCELSIQEIDTKCEETISYLESTIDDKEDTIDDKSVELEKCFSLNTIAWDKVSKLKRSISDLNTSLVDLNTSINDLNC